MSSVTRRPGQVSSSPGLSVGYGNGNSNTAYGNANGNGTTNGNHDYHTQDNYQQYQQYQNGGDNVKRSAPKNPYGKDGSKKPIFALKVLPWFLSTAFFALFVLSRHQVSLANEKLVASQSIVKDEVQSCSKRIRDLNLSNSHVKQEMAKNTQELSRMKSEWGTERTKLNNDLLAKDKMIQDSVEVKSEKQVEAVAWKTRETAWKSSTMLLQQKIERESYREALELFGPGPHTVKFYVDIPRDSEKDAMIPAGEHPSFTIELYPLIHMPHSVHLFLEQVNHGLWDGCSFVVNAPHILQAGTFPGGNTAATYADKIRAFEEVGLDIVSYQEYHHSHPHEQWTVGFAGRPGGPDFYINKLDNTKNHGPGGQSHHNLEEEADPCFGFIKDGKDVLNRMYVMKTDQKNDWVLDHPVHIVKARIVTEDGVGNTSVQDIRKARAIPHLNEMQGNQGFDVPGIVKPGAANPVDAKTNSGV